MVLLPRRSIGKWGYTHLQSEKKALWSHPEKSLFTRQWLPLTTLLFLLQENIFNVKELTWLELYGITNTLKQQLWYHFTALQLSVFLPLKLF